MDAPCKRGPRFLVLRAARLLHGLDSQGRVPRRMLLTGLHYNLDAAMSRWGVTYTWERIVRHNPATANQSPEEHRQGVLGHGKPGPRSVSGTRCSEMCPSGPTVGRWTSVSINARLGAFASDVTSAPKSVIRKISGQGYAASDRGNEIKCREARDELELCRPHSAVHIGARRHHWPEQDRAQ